MATTPTLTDPYQYNSINASSGPEQEIRLLTLFPGEFGSQIRCKLTAVRLADVHPFEALSYTWGDPKGLWCTTPCQGDLEAVYIIEAEGKSLSVGYNLWSALQHLRFVERPRILWVDAISINQNDEKEKSHQVRVMGQIYSCATQVVAWLGEKDKFVDPAFDALEEICWAKRAKIWKYCAERLQKPVAAISYDDVHMVMMEPTLSGPGDEGNPFMCLSSPRPSTRIHFVDALFPAPTICTDTFEDLKSAATSIFGQSRILARRLVTEPGDFLDGYISSETKMALLETFDARSYWRRLWIVQELVLARKITFVCEDRHLDIKDFVILQLIAYAVENQSAQSSTPSSITDINTVSISGIICRSLSTAYFREIHASMTLPLYHWLETCSHYQCSDPRDRIYALLGISAPIGIMVDYTFSIERSYAQAAKEIIKQQRNLDVIFRRAALDVSSNVELSSWVPRFDAIIVQPPAESRMGGAYDCGGTLEPDVGGQLSVSFNDLSLEVQGYFCGELSRVCHSWGTEQPTWNEIVQLADSLEAISPAVFELIQVDSGTLTAMKTSHLENPAFWRTLLMDIYRDRMYLEARITGRPDIRNAFVHDICIALNSDPPTRLMQQLRVRLGSRAFCLSADGKMVLAPNSAKEGDRILLARGASMPLIIRSTEKGKKSIPDGEPRYTLVGAAFIYEYMDGGPMEELERSERERDRAILV